MQCFQCNIANQNHCNTSHQSEVLIRVSGWYFYSCPRRLTSHSGSFDWPYSDSSPLFRSICGWVNPLLPIWHEWITRNQSVITCLSPDMPDFHVTCLRVFILPPWIPFQVQPPAFYTLVAEFEARGFDSTTTPESGVCARILRLSSFYDVISVA